MNIDSKPRNIMLASESPRDTDRKDTDLILRIVRGDECAFRQFYRRHASTVFALCLRILGNRHDAEEVLAEVFWDIWNKSRRYDSSRSSPRSYLMLVTRSRAIDRKRGVMRHSAVESAEQAVADRRISDEVTPLQRVCDDEQRDIVRQALASLDPLQRRAVQLAFFDGLTHREIAQRCNWPLGTAKTRVRKGLQKLKSTLKTMGKHGVMP